METGTRPKLIESGDFYSSLYLNDLSLSRSCTQHLGVAALSLGLSPQVSVVRDVLHHCSHDVDFEGE